MLLPPMRAPATAKLNLALVVGPRRPDGLHAVMTVLQRLALADRVTVRVAGRLQVTGFHGDTLVREALASLAERAGVEPGWHVHLDKRIPVAAGLGGGSSDAATALRLANVSLAEPLSDVELHKLAASLGADVPFFLTAGPQLGEHEGTLLSPLVLPSDYWVLLVLPHGQGKRSTADVYAAFDARHGERDFEVRRAALLGALAGIRRSRELERLPANDLAASPLLPRLRELGAFRAGVTGAGPTVYGLFHHRADAQAAQRRVRAIGRTWLTVPAWYG